MLYWEYRICKEKRTYEFNGKVEECYEYGVIEVYTENDEIEGWCDVRKDVLVTYDLEDMYSIVKAIKRAFKKPVLLIEGEDLIETEEVLC